MLIVIDIDEELYSALKFEMRCKYSMLNAPKYAIANGIPLQNENWNVSYKQYIAQKAEELREYEPTDT